jgi:XTP/dITP diphosphohydrolase
MTISRCFKDHKILLATSNAGKLKEFQKLFSLYNVELISTEAFDIQPPEETGTTYSENAQLKAAYYGRYAQIPTLADDSGLNIDALHGQPGIYSARWAASGFTLAIKKIEEELNNLKLSSSKASFTCALSLWWPDQHMETYCGEVFGDIVFPPRGDKGFGYDPIFKPVGYDMTFAEMDKDLKNSISHRANAFAKLIQSCFANRA